MMLSSRIIDHTWSINHNLKPWGRQIPFDVGSKLIDVFNLLLMFGEFLDAVNDIVHSLYEGVWTFPLWLRFWSFADETMRIIKPDFLTRFEDQLFRLSVVPLLHFIWLQVHFMSNVVVNFTKFPLQCWSVTFCYLFFLFVCDWASK